MHLTDCNLLHNYYYVSLHAIISKEGHITT